MSLKPQRVEAFLIDERIHVKLWSFGSESTSCEIVSAGSTSLYRLSEGSLIRRASRKGIFVFCRSRSGPNREHEVKVPETTRREQNERFIARRPGIVSK